MSVAYKVYAFENHPIESISEFSAIDGGIAHALLLTLTCYSWAVVLCAVSFELENKINDNDKEYNFTDAVNIGDMLEVIGCFGLVMIGTFELDAFNSTLQMFHYIGAGLGVGTLAGFLYQQYIIGVINDNIIAYLILPIILIIFATIGFIMWQYYGFVAMEYPPNQHLKDSRIYQTIRNCLSPCLPDKYDLDKITIVSLKNVISEAVFLFCGCLAMCLWLVFYHDCHQHPQCRL